MIKFLSVLHIQFGSEVSPHPFALRALALNFTTDKNGKPKRLAVRLTELQRQTFNIAGGAIRKTAKRSLRRAKQKPASEMTPNEARGYAAWKRDFEAGRTTQRPRSRYCAILPLHGARASALSSRFSTKRRDAKRWQRLRCPALDISK